VDAQQFHQQIESDVLRLTRIKSRQLAGKYGFARYDAQDIQQDLLLDYLKRAPCYNAHRCNPRTFAHLVVRNRVSRLIEERSAACRDYRQVSVDGTRDTQDPNSTEICAVRSRVAGRNTGFEARLNLRLDVERALTRLPRPLAGLCRLLMICETSSEAAARAGISRATLYRHIRDVRAAFTQAGLDN
jgi:DNA-directed RNA polymerase specialized sigma24 family protein